MPYMRIWGEDDVLAITHNPARPCGARVMHLRFVMSEAALEAAAGGRGPIYTCQRCYPGEGTPMPDRGDRGRAGR